MKKQLRQQILAHRSSLSAEHVLSKSLEIKKLLYTVPEFCAAKTLLLYYSVNNEVYTHDIIQESLAKNTQKKVLLPKLMLGNLKPVEIKTMAELVQGMYKIMESKQGDVFEGTINVVLVPGVVFDMQKNRIGMGKGYYDAFLTTLAQRGMKIFKIGLAYEFQMVDLIPVEHSDVAMDIIITEKRIIR